METLPKDYYKIANLIGTQKNKKNICNDDANQTLYNRIPDYRSQLLWKSDITLNGDAPKEVEFFTSDMLPVISKICLEGLQTMGFLFLLDNILLWIDF